MFRIFVPALSLVLVSSAQMAPHVPRGLLRATGAHPLAFVRLLAESGVPAGIEIKQQDRMRVAPLEKSEQGPPSTVPLSELASAFNAAHADYQASITDGVLIVRPRQIQQDYLDAGAPPRELSGVGLMPVATQLFVPLDSKLQGGAGQAASMLGPIGIEVDRGEQIPIRVNGSGRTVLQVLNDIALQAPGHPWFVATEGQPAKIIRFGFVHKHGTTTEQSITP